jgi:hypothetical protein
LLGFVFLLVLNGFRGGDFDNNKARCGIYQLEWMGKQFNPDQITRASAPTRRELKKGK